MSKKAIIAMSGGVDSSVAAKLLLDGGSVFVEVVRPILSAEVVVSVIDIAVVA